MRRDVRRWYAPAVLTLLAAGGIAFFASSRVWARGTVAATGLPSDSVAVSGSDAHPLVSALAVVVVAASLAVLATGGRARRVVGVITMLAALGGAWVVVTGGDAVDRAFSDAVAESPAFTGGNEPDNVVGALWPVVAVVAFVVAAAIGMLTTVLAGRWSTMGRRYERPGRAAPVTPETEADIWKALDEGRDPTE